MEKIEVLDWKKLLLPYEQAVTELEMKFRNIADGYIRMGEYSPIEMVSGRVKSVMSIIEKARRKEIPIAEIDKYIDDIAGVRVVTKFVEDIAKVVLMVRERDGKDLIVLGEKDYIRKTKSSGYRSYHIKIKYPIYTSLGFREIPAEIQIRTMTMNYWATVEHSLRYKYHDDIPDDIRERLQRCSETAYRLDDEMASIRSEIIESQKEIEIKAALINEIMDKIAELHFSVHLDEAKYLNKEFYDLYEENDTEKLYAFSKQLSVLLELHRVHGTG